MSRYRYIWDANGPKAEIDNGKILFWREDPEVQSSNLPRPMVVRDIEPYRNMIDGREITSRSEHRELLRRHNCIEIGNEKMESKPVLSKGNRRETIARRLGDMSDRQANQILTALRKGN